MSTPTITVFGWEMPAPMTQAPPDRSKYWVDSSDGVHSAYWYAYPVEINLLRNGRCFRTESDARAWYDLNIKIRAGGAK